MEVRRWTNAAVRWTRLGTRRYLAPFLTSTRASSSDKPWVRLNGRHLTLRALEMAIKRGCPDPELLHHSDQGCTYGSEDYRASARTAGHHLFDESPRQL